MNDLGSQLETSANTNPEFRPAIFDTSKVTDQTELSRLFDNNQIQQVNNDYEEQLRELFQVQNPSLVYSTEFNDRFEQHRRDLDSQTPQWQQGRWVYFPWDSTLVHILPEADFWQVRTARNKNLITAAEQGKYYNAVIGIGGLSVGNSVALALVLQGGAKHLKLADHDRLALSNTNRIRTGVTNLGLLKVEMTARQIYELNPYAQVEIFPDGLTPENIEEFFNGLDVVVDELDNLAVKYLIREQAKKHRLAVIMAADNGDNAVVDIERYDLKPDTKYFHGRMGEVGYEMLKKLDKFGIGKLITKHIGPENVTERMCASLLEMGKTIVSWPQLGGAALINGCAVAYCVRKIVCGQPLEPDRALISLDGKLIPDYNQPTEIARRQKSAADFKKIFDL